MISSIKIFKLHIKECYYDVYKKEADKKNHELSMFSNSGIIPLPKIFDLSLWKSRFDQKQM